MARMKKVFLLVIPLLLAGCESPADSGSAVSSEADSDRGIIQEDTEITFLCMADEKYDAKLQKMVDEFEIEEPHVTVNLTNPLGSGAYASIARSTIAGFYKEDYPDIVQCYPDDVMKYMSYGKVLNLDPYLNSSEIGLSDADKADYIQAFMDEGAH